MKKRPEKLTYESDGEMGKQKKTENQKVKRNEKDMFFNSTQNSE